MGACLCRNDGALAKTPVTKLIPTRDSVATAEREDTIVNASFPGRWFVTVALVLALGSACGSGTSTPKTGAGSLGTGPIWFASLQMISPEAGWALRWTQNPTRPGRATLAAAVTSDGGHTWTSVTPPEARSLLTPTQTAAVLYALDAQRAWLAITRHRHAHAAVTVVFATADGGRTWTRSANLVLLGEARWLDFRDARHGWLMTDLGSAMGSEAVAVYRTRDGGMHWPLVARTPALTQLANRDGRLPVACAKTGISLATNLVGFVTGACNGPASLAYVSHDGGRRWASQALPISQAALKRLCLEGCQASPPSFFGATGILSMSSASGGILFVTHDDGASWRAQPLPDRASAFASVEFVDPDHGFLIPIRAAKTSRRLLYTTSDEGRTWTAIHSSLALSRLGESIDFVSPTTGFAWTLGADATTGPPGLFLTRDAGSTWTRIIPRLTVARGTPKVIVNISWTRAASLVRNCRVKRVEQTHSRLVTITLRDGGLAFAYEPRIDAIGPVVNRADTRCGPITFATE